MVQAIGDRAGHHALDAEAVKGGGAGDIGINTGADIDRTIFIGVADHKSVPPNLNFNPKGLPLDILWEL